MAPNHHIRYLLTFSFLALFFLAVPLLVDSSPSFGFQKFDKGSNFESQIALYGDTKVDENGSYVQITGSWNLSAGRVMYRKPIKLVEGNPRRKASFGTYFSFSLSPEDGDGLAFVMLPVGFSLDGYDGTLFGLSNELAEKKNRPFVIEFDTKIDAKYGDLNGNHVGIDVGSLVSVKVTNASDVKLVLNSGEKLQCWIDYEATSKRIEVRLSKLGKKRPSDPLISYPIDLSEMFKNKPVFLGLSSSTANSTQICNLYSWSFKLRQVPYWMHSQPLDPEAFTKDAEPVALHKRSDCILRVLTALIFGTGCGALGAFIALFVWTVFVTKRPVAPEEYVVTRPVNYEYDKVKVLVVEKSAKDDDRK